MPGLVWRLAPSHLMTAVCGPGRQPGGKPKGGGFNVTPQEWKEVEESLNSFYSTVELRCDGYEVTLALRRIDQFKNAIFVYVNGVIKGEWLIEDCEERRRFLRPVKRSLLSQKQKAALKRISKRLRQNKEIAHRGKIAHHGKRRR